MGHGRIHFTIEDLARTRVAAPDPVTETLFAFKFLRRYGRPGPFPRWWADVGSRLSERSDMEMLTPLLPGPGRCLDLFTLCGHAGSVDGAVEALRNRTPRHPLTEAAYAGSMMRLPSWARYMAAADRAAFGLLGEAIRGASEALVTPYWASIQAHLNAERNGYGRVILDSGVERMLGALHPAVRWEPPVLEIPYARDHDFHLRGRGLTVVPSVFCRPLPVLVFDCSPSKGIIPQTWLFVPARSPDIILARPLDSIAVRQSMTALLGRTRAAALLVTAAGPVTTSELARRVGVSLAAASEQASVLRGAGLIITQRFGQAVRHTITPAGQALLTANALDPTAPKAADHLAGDSALTFPMLGSGSLDRFSR